MWIIIDLFFWLGNSSPSQVRVYSRNCLGETHVIIGNVNYIAMDASKAEIKAGFFFGGCYN